ncbi:MAG: glycosyltransferase [Mycobacterium sp.]
MSSYLFALVDGGGTVPPELGAARRLVERGHRVEVLAEDSMIQEVQATGAIFRPWTTAINRPDRRPENDPFQDWEIRTPFQLFTRMLDGLLATPAPAYAADLTAAIKDRRPDLVVCSFFAIGAMVAAEGAGVPYHVLMANIYGLPARGLPPFGLGLQPSTNPLSRVRNWAIRLLVTRQWNKGLGRVNALRESYGLGQIADFWDQARRASKLLVLSSSSFDFPAELPGNVYYVGPVLDDPAWAVDQVWNPPPGENPLVLVAMSSTFQDQVDCLQRVIESLASLPVSGIVTTGQSVDPTALRPTSNVQVLAAAPHSEVLKHASAVVTHGGHGTVVRALAAGVPLVVIPQGRDQADNAARVAARGAGITVKSGAHPEEIAGAVRQILGDAGYREAAARLGRIIREDAASGALVAELESPSMSAIQPKLE